jgi:hypothetical protein
MPLPDLSTLELVQLAGAGCVVILAPIVLIIGFRLLIPFRILRRPLRLLNERVGPVSFLLCVLWTVAFVPDPFLFVWNWLIGFGQALLVNTPQEVARVLPSIVSSCANATATCADGAGNLAVAIWAVAVSPPARAMQVPPDSAKAVLVFAAAVTIVAIGRPSASQPKLSGLFNQRAGALAALTLSFAAAFYLGIVSILAIPIVNGTIPDIVPLEGDLAIRMKEFVQDDKFPVAIQLFIQREQFGKELDNINSTPLAGAGSIKPEVDPIVRIQVQAWDQMSASLKQRLDAFDKDAAAFARTAMLFFESIDQGRVDVAATKRHATLIVARYGLWVAAYRANIENCTAALRTGLDALNIWLELIKAPPPNAPAAAPAASRFSYGDACSRIKPIDYDYLPARSGPSETLGLFGLASAWLLKTESPELTLIVGLLGFGFFGALAASFIREFKATPGNTLPPMGFIVPALIRGIGAAILVFLLAKGGMAILTKGDATPNAYAIFFACFVAAVFSDDIWLWARNRQRREFGGGDDAANGQGGAATGPQP